MTWKAASVSTKSEHIVSLLFSLNMLLVFPVTNKYLSSKFQVICCNSGCNFGRLPGLSIQQVSKQPKISRQLEKFSAPPWAHTLASNGYINVNTIAIFSSVLLELAFYYDFVCSALAALQCEPLLSKGEQQGDSLQNCTPDLKQRSSEDALSLYLITEI